MYTPKVSIVIPVYNGADFVAEAIDSALAQSYPNIEVIIVNDGSCDGGATEQVILGYGERVRYFSTPNGGVASALNLGIRHADGEYISWLSHDDLYVPNKVQRSIEFLMATNQTEAIIYSDYSVFTDSPNRDTIMPLRGVAPEEFRYWLTIENSLHGCTLLIPRVAFEFCGYFNEELRTTQDYDLWFRMAKNFRFVHLPEVLVKARSHGQQGSITMGDVARRECNALLSGFVKDLSVDELRLGSGAHPIVAYMELARSMRRRGFEEAATTSIRLGLQNFPEADMKSRLRGLGMFAKIGTSDMIYGKARTIVKKLVTRLKYRRPRAIKVETNPVDEVNNLPLQEKFTKVYSANIFGGAESRSGAGSDLVQTEVIRKAIPLILKKYNVESMLDAPCGDWFWMQHVDFGIKSYIGVDIVRPLTEKNQAIFGREGIEFSCVDLSKDALPCADLIFSRDCLVHLSYNDTLKILHNFKASGAKYLLTTTFTDRASNSDLGNGFWRPLNMQLAPFNFPSPLELVNEGCTEGNNLFRDKALGLWLLDDLELS